jgi:hypothetical protein
VSNIEDVVEAVKRAVDAEKQAIAQMLKARAALHEFDGGHKRPCDQVVADVLRSMAKRILMTEVEVEREREEQRRSFAYGNVALENAAVTRAMVDEAAERLKAASDASRIVRCQCGGSVSPDGGAVHAVGCEWLKRLGRREVADKLDTEGVRTESGERFPSRSVARRIFEQRGDAPPKFVPTRMKEKKS